MTRTIIFNLISKFYFPLRNNIISSLFTKDTKTILFGKNIQLHNINNLFLGIHVLINSNFKTIGNGLISINDYTYLAPNITIVTSTHNTMDMQETIKDVKIEKLCWIGANVLILPGVTIGEGAIIGAGSIVSKNIPPYTISYGNPIKIIKKRIIRYPYRLPGGKNYLLKDGTMSTLNV